MGLRRLVFTELDGFDSRFPVNYNDVDLCLRARDAGYEVVFEPRALLRHDECQTRIPGTRIEERNLFHQRWSEALQRPDPYFSPLLSLDSEEIKLGAGDYRSSERRRYEHGPVPIPSDDANEEAEVSRLAAGLRGL